MSTRTVEALVPYTWRDGSVFAGTPPLVQKGEAFVQKSAANLDQGVDYIYDAGSPY
jgi:hypothetical protein